MGFFICLMSYFMGGLNKCKSSFVVHKHQKRQFIKNIKYSPAVINFQFKAKHLIL